MHVNLVFAFCFILGDISFDRSSTSSTGTVEVSRISVRKANYGKVSFESMIETNCVEKSVNSQNQFIRHGLPR